VLLVTAGSAPEEEVEEPEEEVVEPEPEEEAPEEEAEEPVEEPVEEPEEEVEPEPEVPEEPVCEEQPDAETVTYDFCEVEASMYRAIFHLSDINQNGIVQYDEMLFFLEAFNPSSDQLAAQFETIDTDGCGFVTWQEVREYSVGSGFTDKGADAQVVIY